MKKIIVLMLVVLACGLNAEQYLIRINIAGNKNGELVKKFSQDGEDIAARGKDYIDLVVEKDRMPEFAHLSPTIIYDHDPVAKLRAKGDLGIYHTYYEMLTEMQALAAQNPNIMQIINLGSAWEKANGVTGADRDLIAIKISDNVAVSEEEPQILLDADHHAREIITPEIIISVAKKLIEGYNNNDPEIKYYVNQREIYLVPIVNPDGHNFVANVNGMWRKNRHKYGTNYGADLNRNYGYHWGEAGASSSPSNDTYRGSAAFSEPETAIMRDFARTKNFVFNISYHSYSNLILFPWGYDYTVTNPDRAIYQQLADSMAAVNGYATGAPGELLYDASGGGFDWHYGDTSKPVTLAFSPEIGSASDTFAPPESRVQALINENVPNCMFLIRQADDPYLKRPILQSDFLMSNYLAGPFYTDLKFATTTMLDSVFISYKPAFQDSYMVQKLNKLTDNQFNSTEVTLGQEGEVAYYYTAYFNYKGKKYKITYPKFGEQKPWNFHYWFQDNIENNRQISTSNILTAYPNPFNSTTRINLNLAVNQSVNISLFDITGREVKKIAENKNLSAGNHTFDLNVNLSAGIYFIKTTGNRMTPLIEKINYLK